MHHTKVWERTRPTKVRGQGATMRGEKRQRPSCSCSGRARGPYIPKARASWRFRGDVAAARGRRFGKQSRTLVQLCPARARELCALLFYNYNLNPAGTVPRAACACPDRCFTVLRKGPHQPGKPVVSVFDSFINL